MIALLIAAAVQLSFEDLNAILKAVPDVQHLAEMEEKAGMRIGIPGAYQSYKCNLADQAEQATYSLKILKLKGYVFLEDPNVRNAVGSLDYTFTEKDLKEIDIRILDMERTRAGYRAACLR